MPDPDSSKERINLLAAFALLQMEWKDLAGSSYTVPFEVVEDFLHFCDPTQNTSEIVDFWFRSGWIFQIFLRRWQMTSKGLTALIEQRAKFPIDENGVADWIRTYTPR